MKEELEAIAMLLLLIIGLGMFIKKFTENTFIGGLIRFAFDIILSALSPFLGPLLERLKGWFAGKSTGIHGTGRFLSWAEKKKLLSPMNKGFTISGAPQDRLSVKDSQKHGLGLAPSGFGKTSCLVIPSVLQASGSLVINDPDGSIYEATAGHLSEQGYDIKVLNLSDPQQSLQYNPIHYANTPSEIARLADAILNSSLETGGKDNFWNESAKKLMILLIKALKTQDEKYHTIASLSLLLDEFGTDGTPLIDLFLRTNEQTQKQFKGILSAKEEILQDIVMTCRTILKLFDDPAMCHLTIKDTLDFKTLRKRPTAIYLISSEVQFDTTIQSIFFTQLFDFLKETPSEDDLDIQVFADEAGNFKVPKLERLITVLRRRRVSVLLIIQDLSQWNLIYSPDIAKVLFSNSFCKIIFPGLSLETCKMVSEMMGTQTVRYKNPHAEEEEGKNESKEVGRRLMDADEIFTMQDGAIVFMGNNRPYLTALYPYYKNPMMKKLSDKPAPYFPYYEIDKMELIDLSKFTITMPDKAND